MDNNDDKGSKINNIRVKNTAPKKKLRSQQDLKNKLQNFSISVTFFSLAHNIFMGCNN